VTFVVENIPFGADHRLRKQVDSVLAAGHRATVVTMRDEANAPYRDRAGLRLLEYPPPREPAGPAGYVGEYAWSFVCAAALLLRVRLRGRIDVVQVCQPPDIWFPLTWLLGRTGSRVVVDQRDLMPELLDARYERAPALARRVLHALERMTQRVADRTLTVNDTLRERMVGAGARPEQVGVVWNGPVLARVEAARPDPGLVADGRSLVVWVGKMGLQDRVELVLEVADAVVHRLGRTDCRFVLIGDGECLDDLRRRCTELDLDACVAFTGWVPEETVFGHLASAELGLDTSLQHEVTPVKAMEYMAFGLPFACFDLPETRRLAAEAAVLVPPGDVEALAGAVVGLLDDEPRRKQLGEAGRRVARERVAWERQAETYLDAVGPSGQP